METADEVLPPAAAADVPAITTQVAEYSPLAGQLHAMAVRLQDRAYNLATVAGNKEARADRKTLVSLRTGLESLRLQHNKADRETIDARIGARNTEADRLRGLIESYETPIDEQIKADEARRETERKEREAAEAARVAAIRQRIDAMTGLALRAVGKPSADIADKLAMAEGLTIAADVFQEFSDEAGILKIDTVAKLRELRIAAVAAEAEAARMAAERAELEQLRQRQAEADAERERQAQIERDRQAEANRIEAARLEKVQQDLQAADAEARKRRDAEAEADRIERERLNKIAADKRAEDDRAAAAARKVEQDRIDAERARIDAERQATEARMAAENRLQREKEEADRLAEAERAEAQRAAAVEAAKAAQARDDKLAAIAPRLASLLQHAAATIEAEDAGTQQAKIIRLALADYDLIWRPAVQS